MSMGDMHLPVPQPPHSASSRILWSDLDDPMILYKFQLLV